MLDRYRDHPAMIRRFIEEAQIGGQLQHPGVVPVYEIGTLSDRRPYFAMKLIKGRTLAELLAGRSNAEENLPRLLSIFEAVCQTVAYTHARGVIHRDLKPSNIMVGSFGEVQVMDWGAAKVLGRRDDHDRRTGRVRREFKKPSSRPARSRSEIADSRAGTVIGTPAYMAPEQARGDIDAVDERADVFALGSILCEILTGQPGFIGTTADEIERQAARRGSGRCVRPARGVRRRCRTGGPGSRLSGGRARRSPPRRSGRGRTDHDATAWASREAPCRRTGGGGSASSGRRGNQAARACRSAGGRRPSPGPRSNAVVVVCRSPWPARSCH